MGRAFNEKMSAEDRKVIESFSKATVDKITVMKQLNAIYDAAMEKLAEIHGQVIPRQSKAELLNLFTEVIEEIPEEK